jgi:hypothetical protein
VKRSRSFIASRARVIALGALVAFSLTAADQPAPERTETASDWAAEANANGVAIHSRTRSGSAIKEFRGAGVIDAPPATVFAVLDDSGSYASFMPYTAESRVLQRDKNSTLGYQRLHLPLVSDRDYTIRSENAKWPGPDGMIYRIRWVAANDLGPAPTPGVIRVNLCEGGWLLEPQGSGATRATYSIYTDSGGAIPPMIANSGSRVAIRKVFEAIRKQVKDPKYAGTAADATREARNRITP